MSQERGRRRRIYMREHDKETVVVIGAGVPHPGHRPPLRGARVVRDGNLVGAPAEDRTYPRVA